MTSVLACPVCGAALTLNAGDAACPAGHRFDRARGGYVNLLLSNQKQSADPGDSAPMLRSRRAFLRGGFYDRMAAAVYTAVGEVVGARVEPHIADLGCGEGYFTAGGPPAPDAPARPPPRPGAHTPPGPVPRAAPPRP